MESGHGLPSRNRARLSSANTPKTGVPNPTVPRIFVPAAASFFASSLLMKSLFGRCTSSGTPASTAATIALELTAWTCTITPTFLPSSTIALRISNSRSLGPGTGVRRDLARKLDPHLGHLPYLGAGVFPECCCSASGTPDGMMRGPLIWPFSM